MGHGWSKDRQARGGIGALAVLVIVFGVLVVVVILVMVAGGLFMAHKARQAGLSPQLLKQRPALAAAQLAIAANPDLETVKVDEKSGRITVRQKSTGKEFTAAFEDLESGKIRLESSDGEVITFEVGGTAGGVKLESKQGQWLVGGQGNADLPGWLPLYPGAEARPVIRSDTPSEKGGTVTFSVPGSLDEVVTFYSSALASQGLRLSKVHQTSPAGAEGAMVVAEAPDGSRRAAVVLGKQGSQVEVSVTWSEKK